MNIVKNHYELPYELHLSWDAFLGLILYGGIDGHVC